MLLLTSEHCLRCAHKDENLNRDANKMRLRISPKKQKKNHIFQMLRHSEILVNKTKNYALFKEKIFFKTASHFQTFTNLKGKWLYRHP